MRITHFALVLGLIIFLASACATSGPDSGIYGWMGERGRDFRIGFGGQKRGYRLAMQNECLQVVDPTNWTTVARAVCNNGVYRVALPPGKYIVLDPRGSQRITIVPHHWIQRDVVME
jgi:hypothetical protein